MKKIAVTMVMIMAAGAASVMGQVVSSFETTNGSYAGGSTVVGEADSSLGGTWALLFGTSSSTNIVSSSADPYPDGGLLSVRVTGTAGSVAQGGSVQATNATSLITSPFTFSLAVNIQSVTAGTGNQFQLGFGNNTSSSDSHWVKLGFDTVGSGTGTAANTVIYLQTGNGSGLYTGVNIGTWSNYAALGDWVKFDFTIDPTTKKYTSVIVSGALGTLDKTSVVQAATYGGTIPWSSSFGTPGTYLTAFAGSNDVVVADIDAFSITAVPEPSTYALVLMGAVGLALLRGRSKKAGVA